VTSILLSLIKYFRNQANCFDSLNHFCPMKTGEDVYEDGSSLFVVKENFDNSICQHDPYHLV
jgi:hypothetical protein